MRRPRRLVATLIALVLGASAAPSSIAQALSFFDEFDGPTLDPQWIVVAYPGPFPRVYGQQVPANHVSLTSRPGHLRYVLDPMTHADGFLNGYRTTYGEHSCCNHDPGLELQRLIGGEQWTLETHVDFFMPYSNGRQLEYRLYFGDGGPGTVYLRMRRSRDVNQDSLHVYLVEKVGPNLFEDDLLAYAYLPTLDSLFYSVRRIGGRLEAWWSEDGVSWSQALSQDLGQRLQGREQHLVITGASWFYPAGSYADYDYVWLSDSSDVAYDWQAPFEATKGRPYAIRVEARNRTAFPRSASVSLQQSASPPPPNLLTDLWFQGSTYTPPATRSVLLQPYETRNLDFVVENTWDWIEPWSPRRFLTLVKNLFLADPSLFQIATVDSIRSIVLPFVHATNDATFDYIGTAGGNDEAFSVTVRTSIWRAVALWSSILFGHSASLATTAGVVSRQPDLLLAEVVLFAAGEASYLVAVDPQDLYRQLAVPQPPPIPAECLDGGAGTPLIAERSSHLLGALGAFSASVLRYDAAEDAEDADWALLQLSLAQRYADEADRDLRDLAPALARELQDEPLPTADEIAAIRTGLLVDGLPETERCVLTALGYSAEEIGEVELAVQDLADEQFVAFHELPELLLRSGVWLRQVAATAPLPPSTLLATADVDPDTLNLKSRGRWITVYLELGEGADIADVDCAGVRLFFDQASASCERSPSSRTGDHDGDGIEDLAFNFDRAAVAAHLRPGLNVVPLTGMLLDGSAFAATDVIRVLDSGRD